MGRKHWEFFHAWVKAHGGIIENESWQNEDKAGILVATFGLVRFLMLFHPENDTKVRAFLQISLHEDMDDVAEALEAALTEFKEKSGGLLGPLSFN